MKKVTNECVCCGLPCLGESCPYRRVVRYYCDKCGREEKLYYYDEKIHLFIVSDGHSICRQCTALEQVIGKER